MLGAICNTLWAHSQKTQYGIPYSRKEWRKGANLSTTWKQYTLLKKGGLEIVRNGEYGPVEHRYLVDILMDATAKEQAPQNIDLCIQLRKVGIGRFQQLLLSNTATKTAEEDINTIKLKSAETLAKEHKIKQPIDKELGNRIKLLYDLLGANLLGKDYYIYRKSMHPAILDAVKRTCNPETQIQNTRQHTLTDFLNPTSIKTKKLKRKEREQPTNQSGRIREWNLSNENERKRMIVTTVCGPKRRAKV